MAYEVKDWKAPGCSLILKTDKLSDRETFSAEINEKYGEGGGLNANYRTVEAMAVVANILGCVNGFNYSEHFVFKTSGLDEIVLDFRSQEERDAAERTIREYQIKKATDPCPDCGKQLVHQEGILSCRSCGYQSAPC